MWSTNTPAGSITWSSTEISFVSEVSTRPVYEGGNAAPTVREGGVSGPSRPAPCRRSKRRAVTMAPQPRTERPTRGEPSVEGEQGRFEDFGERDVQRVVPAEVVAQLPRVTRTGGGATNVRRATTEGRRRPGSPRSHPGHPGDAGSESRTALPRRRDAVRLDLDREQTAAGALLMLEYRRQSRTARWRQRSASGHAPRTSSSASTTSARLIFEGRRRVRSSHSSTDGRLAKRATSRRRRSGTVNPASAARRASAA